MSSHRNRGRGKERGKASRGHGGNGRGGNTVHASQRKTTIRNSKKVVKQPNVEKASPGNDSIFSMLMESKCLDTESSTR